MSGWLPEGYSRKYGLHVVHKPAESGGSFTGGGHKWVWHITVSDPRNVDGVADVLVGERSCPHILIGFRPKLVRPVVYQFVPFNEAGRALVHSGPTETNRANAIQCEIAAQVADVAHFDEWGYYKALANLVRFCNDHMSPNVPWDLARAFSNTNRFGNQEFVDVAGHCGHMHVPQNDHVDPTTAFKGGTLMWRLKHMPKGGWPLKGVGPS